MAKKDQAEKNRRQAEKLKAKIAQQLKKGAGKGVEAACRFLVARIKETVSVPAPKKKVGTNVISYRATARAIPGAPPRVLSGRLRQGVTHQMLSPILGMVGVHARGTPSKKRPEGFNYPRFHETGDENGDRLGEGDHPFIAPTVKKYERELKIIVGTEARVEMKKGGW